MDQQQIDLVRTSYARIAPRADVVGAEFHRCLFALSPALRPLFGGDLQTQTQELMGMFRSVVERLDQPDQLLTSCRRLGLRHAGHEVQESHYDAVGTALLMALHAGLGGAYTADVEEAWAAVYGEIAEAMIAAGQAALS